MSYKCSFPTAVLFTEDLMITPLDSIDVIITIMLKMSTNDKLSSVVAADGNFFILFHT